MATEIVKNNNNNVQFKLGEKEKKGSVTAFPTKGGAPSRWAVVRLPRKKKPLLLLFPIGANDRYLFYTVERNEGNTMMIAFNLGRESAGKIRVCVGYTIRFLFLSLNHFRFFSSFLFLFFFLPPHSRRAATRLNCYTHFH